ncbi:MAG: ribonuclease HII [Myxococcota bacterium]|nr:ribonuclease HII [Myxococcota bacterium]
MRILGLDEAGRGCVLGPLVVGGFLTTKDDLDRIRQTGATDSKKLSAKRRERILPLLEEIGEAHLVDISPQQIDNGNLNALEEEAFATLILRTRPDGVIIDAPCHPRGIPQFLQRLVSRIGYQPHLIVEPKADLNHPPCSAASIFAKVHRDAQIQALGNVGSGYPSDPVTRAWLKDFIDRGEDFPDCVRTRWGTIRNLAQGRLL